VPFSAPMHVFANAVVISSEAFPHAWRVGNSERDEKPSWQP
jgi:hypothetical protein